MKTLQVQNINLAFAERDLLKDINFTVNTKTRCALVGGNGEGKSTLLKIICSQIQPDFGLITKTKQMIVSYLPQSNIILSSNTVYEEIEKGYVASLEKVTRLEEIDQILKDNPNDLNIINEQLQLHEDLSLNGFYMRKARIGQISTGLGFKETDLQRPCSSFSGGYQMRIALAKILAENPDILLLDEPTNYLDIETRIWLKNYLKTYNGGLILVCHDRYFLDETVNEIFELFNSHLTNYKGNYTQYENTRNQELLSLENEAKRQQEQIAKTEVFIEKFRYKANKSKQVQSRIKQLEKIEPIVIPSHLRKLTFSFPPAPHSPNDVVIIENLCKSYDKNKIYQDFSLIINKGERVAISGQNGTGKSTLLRILAKMDTNYTGKLRFGPEVSIGYYAQDNETFLKMENTVFEELESSGTTSDQPRLRSMLGAFLFSGDDIYKKVQILSGGEKSRLALLKILLKPANLLILDEPTNHLDINSQEALVRALKKYQGTLIFVSHDSEFLSTLATKIVYLGEGDPQTFEGDYSYFKWKLEQQRKIENENETEILNSKETTPKQETDYKEAKKKRNLKQKLEIQVQQALEDADNARIKIEKLNIEMGKIENYSDAEIITKLIKEKEETEKELSDSEENWFNLNESLEEIENNE
ncbi:MAG: ABC-F family ATP-binding cassette domain-containing protein [Sphaerochaetaceae bacterium]